MQESPSQQHIVSRIPELTSHLRTSLTEPHTTSAPRLLSVLSTPTHHSLFFTHSTLSGSVFSLAFFFRSFFFHPDPFFPHLQSSLRSLIITIVPVP